jgi:hypothetical protein
MAGAREACGAWEIGAGIGVLAFKKSETLISISVAEIVEKRNISLALSVSNYLITKSVTSSRRFARFGRVRSRYSAGNTPNWIVFRAFLE